MIKVKQTQKDVKTFRTAVLIIVFSVFVIIEAFSSNYLNNNEQNKTIAVLVIRVGNLQAYSPMTKITLKTDYSKRIPEMGQYVYIDNEMRLNESVPNYPNYTGNTSDYHIEYFKNISPYLFSGIQAAFENKGYEVSDLKKISESWDKSFSEMTVKSITEKLEQEVDYLFILQYMDVANSSVVSKYYNLHTVRSGFTSLVFSYSMFDVKKQKIIFSYSPIMPFAVLPALIYNPKIMEDENLRKRIEVECKGENGKITITHDFDNIELVDILKDYIINGFQCPEQKYIECYDECKYYNVKGLREKIPE